MGDRDTSRKGITVAEFLLIVAIIVVFLMIAVPVVQHWIERGHHVADMASARTAFGLAMSEKMILSEGTCICYYDGAMLVNKRPKYGYGMSKDPFETFAPDDFPVRVSGTPKRAGKQMFLVIKCGPEGVEKMIWGGYPIAVNAEEYKALSPEERVQADHEILDLLQSGIRGMTYGQLAAIFKEPGTNEYDDKYHPEKGFEGRRTFTLALSNIDPVSGEIIDKNLPKGAAFEGYPRNVVLCKEIFDTIGYDTTLKTENQYLIFSHNYKTSSEDVLTIKVSLPMDPLQMEAKKKANKKAKGAVVYLEGNDVNARTGSFGYYTRKNPGRA